MAIALVAHTAQGLGATGGTTTGIDTTGSDLIVLVISMGGSFSESVSDSKGNTWTKVNTATGGPAEVMMYYSKNPTVGTGHTFTCTGGDGSNSGFIGMGVITFSGSNLTSPLDKNSAATATSAGSVTPAEDNEVLVAGLSWYPNGVTVTVDGSFAITDQNDYLVGGNNLGVAVAYLIQTSASAANPTWSRTGGFSGAATTIGTYKAGTGGGAMSFKAAWCKNTNVVQSIGRGL